LVCIDSVWPRISRTTARISRIAALIEDAGRTPGLIFCFVKKHNTALREAFNPLAAFDEASVRLSVRSVAKLNRMQTSKPPDQETRKNFLLSRNRKSHYRSRRDYNRTDGRA
jgi:hypothetical protein